MHLKTKMTTEVIVGRRATAIVMYVVAWRWKTKLNSRWNYNTQVYGIIHLPTQRRMVYERGALNGHYY